MINVRVARRYAEALVELGERGKNLDAVIRDFELLRETIRGSREFLLFLRSPVISKEKKRTVLMALFSGQMEPSTLEALGVIALKGREELLPDIIDQFFKIWDERQGIVRVEVKAAIDFSNEQTDVLKDKLERYTQKKVKIAFGLDRQLLGGFVARVGDTV